VRSHAPGCDDLDASPGTGAAAVIGVETAGPTAVVPLRVIADTALPSALPRSAVEASARQPSAEPLIAPEVAAQGLYRALPAVAAAPVRHTAAAASRTVFRTGSGEGREGPRAPLPRTAAAAPGSEERHSRQCHAPCGVTHSNFPGDPGNASPRLGNDQQGQVNDR